MIPKFLFLLKPRLLLGGLNHNVTINSDDAQILQEWHPLRLDTDVDSSNPIKSLKASGAKIDS